MTTLPAAGRFNVGSLTNAQAKNDLDSILAVIREIPGGEARSTLTIATGSVTPTRATHALDTEGATATDDLDRMDYTNHVAGRLVLLSTIDNARDVVIKHGQGGLGQFLLADGANFNMSDTSMRLLVQRVGNDWVEVFRSYGTDKSAARTFLRVGGPWVDVASASTVDLGAQSSTNIRLTGSTTVTSFGTTATSGETYTIRSGGSITITNNDTSLICPGGVSLFLQANDVIRVAPLGSGNWIVTDVMPDQPPVNVWKAPVVVVATTNLTLSGTQTIDGVAVIAGDRVLAAGQTTAANNGIYVVAAGAWSRARDADSWTDLVDAIVPITQGTVGADKIYKCTSNPGGTLGSTAVVFSQFGSTVTITRTVFTSSGTWTKPGNLIAAEVELVGAGGGSGSVAGGGASGGGGGGGYSRKLIQAASLGSTETVTIGAGGTPGTSYGQNGGTGGTTSFGAHLSATGGSGSAASPGTGTTNLGGTGGVGSSGDVNARGSTGGSGQEILRYDSEGNVIGTLSLVLGVGGDSRLGLGSAGQTDGAANSGGGAGGGYYPTTGRTGGSGIVIVTEYRSS